MIRRIDADRYVWPHILDQVRSAAAVQLLNGISGQAVAPDSTGVSVVRFTITGSTVDIQAYTTFLRQLAASPWFTDVMPASSQTVVEQDRPVTAFSVSAHYRVADSVYIHTVPLTQALR